MEPIRTDLAVERTAAAPSLPGVTQETRGNAFSVTEIRIKNDVCGAQLTMSAMANSPAIFHRFMLAPFSARYRSAPGNIPPGCS